MSNEAYKNALAKRDQLQKELAKIDDFLSLYQQFESASNVVVESEKLLDSKAKNNEPALVAQRRKSGKKVKPSVLKDIVKAVLREAGKPLSRREIIEGIETKNSTIPSKDKSGYIGSLLYRFRDEISSSHGSGYWFTGYEAPNSPDSRKN